MPAWRDVVSPLPPEVVHGWATARSIARGLPAPVADHGGWRLDTGSEAEIARYFFAAPSPVIADLAATITTPRIFLKLCDSREAFAPLLPPGWLFAEPTWMMAGEPVAAGPLGAGYRLSVGGDAARCMVRVVEAGGELAASGHGASALGVFAYDRIVTHDAHRRRGLGRAVMAALGAMAPAGATHVLAATAMGRALYQPLGWRVRSDYTTAFVADG